MSRSPEKKRQLSTSKSKLYKSYLLAYAQRQVQQRKKHTSITIHGRSGTIYSQKPSYDFSVDQMIKKLKKQYQKQTRHYAAQLFSIPTPPRQSYRARLVKKTSVRAPKEVILFQNTHIIDRVGNQLSRFDRAYTRAFNKTVSQITRFCKKSFQNTQKSIQTFTTFRKDAERKMQKRANTVARTSRLIRRWNRKKRFEFLSELKNQSSAIHYHWFTQALYTPFKPFYYSFRLYPLHSFMAILLSALIFGGTYSVHEMIFKDLPSVMDLTNKEPIVSSKILDRNGKILYTIYKDENRTPVPLTQISPYLLHATISIEDKEFYDHHGFSPKGIVRAFWVNSQTGTTQGGSTITQQLVKDRLLSREKTVTRKVKELILSVLVEGSYSKDEILQMYLNQVSYGGSTYGIEEASQRYFGKNAKDLDIAESALLAGLPQAPSIYSPFGTNPELAKQRQQEVLRRMVEDQYITNEQANAAGKEQLSFKKDQIDIQAPHFVMYVKQLLAEKYGEDAIYKDGLEIRTTLDLDLQNKSQQLVSNEVKDLQRLHITNGAALVTNPKTGEVLSMVGSKDYFDFAHDGQVNVTIRLRQPGSSIKPVTYATALEKGSTVTSIIQDEPITYLKAGSPPYSPKNYDGKYHGPVPLKEALGSSLNIPAVKTLDSVGIDAMIDKAQAMGITTWDDRKRFGLSLTLGGGEVKMVDMAAVYSTFANKGISTPLNPILEIKNYKNEELYRNTCALDGVGCKNKQALDPKVAYLITNILADNNARIPAFGPISALFIPGQEVAVKTGTTNSLRDNWAIGYTQDRLTAVWVGNNDNTPMSYVASGVTGASPIWNKIMRVLLDENHPNVFAVPDGLVKVATCFNTGTLPCGNCGRVSEEYYVAGTEPTSNCNVAKTPGAKPIGRTPTTAAIDN